jgi:hypothetical protein
MSVRIKRLMWVAFALFLGSVALAFTKPGFLGGYEFAVSLTLSIAALLTTVIAEMIEKKELLALRRSYRVKDKTSVGLFGKFTVTRNDGRDLPGEKHEGCDYFVLDLTHDVYAIPALEAYITAIEFTLPKLAFDLSEKLNYLRRRFTLPVSDVTLVSSER